MTTPVEYRVKRDETGMFVIQRCEGNHTTLMKGYSLLFPQLHVVRYYTRFAAKRAAKRLSETV